MTIPDDGNSAFPWEQSLGNQDNLGLSKRDWFAGMALQGLLAYPGDLADGSLCGVAKLCYQYADAMIAQRREPLP